MGDFTVGTPLYLYSVRCGELKVYEGEVIDRPKYAYHRRWWVKFYSQTRKHPTEPCPTANDIGKVLGSGPRLWLTERNDALARKLFIEFEQEVLRDLKAKVKKKQMSIKSLKEGA